MLSNITSQNQSEHSNIDHRKFTAKSCEKRISKKQLGYDIENSQAQTFKIRVKMYGMKNEFTKFL